MATFSHVERNSQGGNELAIWLSFEFAALGYGFVNTVNVSP